MSSKSLSELIHSTNLILLDFDGPVCSIFHEKSANAISIEMRTELTKQGLEIPSAARTTQDPMRVLSAISIQSIHGQKVAEKLLADAELSNAQNARMTAGVESLLDAAQAADKPVIIVSNNSGIAIELYLTKHDLTQYISHIIGRDPHDAQLMKPNPHLIFKALKLGNTPAAKAIMIGDSLTDITAGNTAGVPVIAYANKPHKIQPMRSAKCWVVESMQTIADALTS
jgi:HAD superfamily hydrolase (TIGR01549 family)